MTNEQLDKVAVELDDVVARTEKYPLHLQPTILRILWDARNGSPGVVAGTDGSVSQAQHVNGSGAMPVNGEATDWDYRRGLDKVAEQHDLNLKSPFDYEYALIVAHVLQYLSPSGFDGDAMTKDHVKDAWKHADRDLPNRLREPLSESAKKGLLQQAKGKSGYTLTLKGENHVRKLFASGDKS